MVPLGARFFGSNGHCDLVMVRFGPVWSGLIRFGPVWSGSVRFGPVRLGFEPRFSGPNRTEPGEIFLSFERHFHPKSLKLVRTSLTAFDSVVQKENETK